MPERAQTYLLFASWALQLCFAMAAPVVWMKVSLALLGGGLYVATHVWSAYSETNVARLRMMGTTMHVAKLIEESRGYPVDPALYRLLAAPRRVAWGIGILMAVVGVAASFVLPFWAAIPYAIGGLAAVPAYAYATEYHLQGMPYIDTYATRHKIERCLAADQVIL